jgi:hypothetical protein
MLAAELLPQQSDGQRQAPAASTGRIRPKAPFSEGPRMRGKTPRTPG